MTTTPGRPPTDAEVQRRISEALSGNERLLATALDQARSSFDHSGNKGNAIERAVRNFLGRHLPTKFNVAEGEVIDRFGSRSPQLDVIVINEYQPYNYGPDRAGMYLCEGVSAVAEVKSSLGSKELKDIFKKGEKFRTLRGTISAGDEAYANPSDMRRYYASAPYFALAIESTISVESTLEALNREPEVPSPEPGGGALAKLDALFVLDKGAFINFGDGRGGLRFLTPDREIGEEGWIFTTRDRVLFSLFLWLHAVMPNIQRRAPIVVPYLVDSMEQLTVPVPEAGDRA